MPCPHHDIKIVQRSNRQSAVAAATYQSGERLFSEYDQKQKYYSEKRGIVHTEIMLPPHAPPEYADRNTLWNAAEVVEKQWNSQLARRIVLAIPREIPLEQHADLIRDYCREFFVSKGMIADFAIHDKGDGNPHAHILLTMRAMDETGKWLPKSRKVYDLDENGERIRLPSGNWKSHKEDTVDWNDQKYGEIWRQGWAAVANRYLEANDRPERLDLRSYERQGLDKIPTVHMGPAVSQMEKRGIQTNIGNLNRDITAANRLMQSIRQMVRHLKGWIADLKEKKAALLEALQEAKEPTLPELLGKYLDLRREERTGWTSKGQLKGTVNDFNKVMDEFFRQNDPQYAAEHPEEHAAKEEIYENLMAGRISALDEKLAALGQAQEDYLPSEIEKFKDATGYEEFLDVDPQVIREAIENPDQSHVDEMLSFAEQANREYEAELYGQPAASTPDDREIAETVRTPRGTFHVTDMSREQMEAAGYGFHHESEDGKYLIMANGSRAFAIPSGAAPEHTAPEKLTVLVVEPMKEPYVKEIDPGLHALQAEVGGDIAASYPFDDPVGLVLNDEGKLIGLDLNRSLRDEHGEIYDIVAGTFLVVGLGPESFASLPPDMIQKYTEQFKRPELFASINGQIVSVPVEPENPLRTAEMTLEDDYGMIDGIINNGRRGEELEKAQTEARRTTPEKKPSIRERLEDAKRECAERKSPDKPAPQKKPPEHDL